MTTQHKPKASIIMREAALGNCKLICKVLSQPEELHKEKFNAFVGQIDNAAYVSPEEMYRRVYNLSIIKLNNLRERLT